MKTIYRLDELKRVIPFVQGREARDVVKWAVEQIERLNVQNDVYRTALRQIAKESEADENDHYDPISSEGAIRIFNLAWGVLYPDPTEGEC